MSGHSIMSIQDGRFAGTFSPRCSLPSPPSSLLSSPSFASTSSLSSSSPSSLSSSPSLSSLPRSPALDLRRREERTDWGEEREPERREREAERREREPERREREAERSERELSGLLRTNTGSDRRERRSRPLQTVFEGDPAQLREMERTGREREDERSIRSPPPLYAYRADARPPNFSEVAHGPAPFLRLLPHPCALCGPQLHAPKADFFDPDAFCLFGKRHSQRHEGDDLCLLQASPCSASKRHPHRLLCAFERRKRLYVSSLSAQTERRRLLPLLALSEPLTWGAFSLPSFSRREKRNFFSSSLPKGTPTLEAEGPRCETNGFRAGEKQTLSSWTIRVHSQRKLKFQPAAASSSFSSSASSSCTLFSSSVCHSCGSHSSAFVRRLPGESVHARQRETHALFSLFSNFALFAHPFGDSPAGGLLAGLLRESPRRGASYAQALFVDEVSSELLACYTSAPHHPPGFATASCATIAASGDPPQIGREKQDARDMGRGPLNACREHPRAGTPDIGSARGDETQDRRRVERGESATCRSASSRAFLERFLVGTGAGHLSLGGLRKETLGRPRLHRDGREKVLSTRGGTTQGSGDESGRREKNAKNAWRLETSSVRNEKSAKDTQSLTREIGGERHGNACEGGVPERSSAERLSTEATGWNDKPEALERRECTLSAAAKELTYPPLSVSRNGRDRIFYTTVVSPPSQEESARGERVNSRRRRLRQNGLPRFGHSARWSVAAARPASRGRTASAQGETRSLSPSFSPPATCGAPESQRGPRERSTQADAPGQADELFASARTRAREEKKKGGRRKESKKLRDKHSPLDPGLFTFYNVDLVGFGKSACIYSPTDYSRREQAERVVKDVIFANKLPAVHLVGHSFGSLVAAEVARILPLGSVKSVLLLAPAYFESTRQAMQILTATHFPAAHSIAHPIVAFFILKIGRLLRPVLEPIFNAVVPKDELPQLSVADLFSIDPDAMVGTILSIVKERLEETLQTLQDRRIRITVVHGTGDGVIPIRQSQ
ncbi:hydrolase, alpha/beta fold family protein [Toxoplasma gondii VAND]|uniref:Hydrolase, alpha/beta fold family protein n=1 Tax=Toxoplasma gondii VAND TaxID=933077 RepID=A0A086QEK0_TOXGO|nr:hydrolase, alpha/beta fold family protein [Toxoplasma gondii VAND]